MRSILNRLNNNVYECSVPLKLQVKTEGKKVSSSSPVLEYVLLIPDCLALALDCSADYCNSPQ